MKLLLTCIFKDDSEYEIAERMLGSFMPHFHGLAVALTGVSGEFDKLKGLIKKYKGEYVVTNPQTHPKIYSNEGEKTIFANFAEARNVSFELASKMQGKGNYDFWSWADVDDLLVSGEELKAAAERSKERDLDALFFTYWYSVRVAEDGTFSHKDVMIEHARERLLRPNVFKWVSRLHEVAVAKEDSYQVKHSMYDFNPKEGRECVWAHITDAERSDKALMRNISILEIQAKEEQHKDPRTLFYLAKTYLDVKKEGAVDIAEQLLYEYLELSGWKEERANAWDYLGFIWERRGKMNKAVECYLESLNEYPNRHQAFINLSKCYSDMGLFEQADFWLDEVLLKMEKPKARTTIGNPMEVMFMAASLKYNQCIRKQKLEDAVFWKKKRNEIAGIEDDGMIKILEDSLSMNRAAQWVFQYAQWLKDKGYKEEIKHLLKSIAPDFKQEAFVQYIASEVAEPRVWEDNEIAYYASWGANHFEDWDEKSLAKGVGGSETAVIRLSEEWAKKGYKVTVYAECPDHEANGVTWKHWNTINWKDEFNTLILWRSPHLLDKDIKAKKIFMDLHDIASQTDWSQARMDKVNKVFFKSKWHRTHLPKLSDEKCVVISNGIDI